MLITLLALGTTELAAQAGYSEPPTAAQAFAALALFHQIGHPFHVPSTLLWRTCAYFDTSFDNTNSRLQEPCARC